MGRKRDKLIEDAKAAGYTVEARGRETIIVKTIKVNKTKTRKDGLVIYEDGVAIRIGIDLAVARGIQSDKEMRAVLGLPEAK